jgi:hypothetical protein
MPKKEKSDFQIPQGFIQLGEPKEELKKKVSDTVIFLKISDRFLYFDKVATLMHQQEVLQSKVILPALIPYTLGEETNMGLFYLNFTDFDKDPRDILREAGELNDGQHVDQYMSKVGAFLAMTGETSLPEEIE